ncbi:hypothetical protein EOC93_02335 [Mesorhizobium sp. M6A.T.Ce.TU.002.03.1.1]|uniref:hypothetical protein n=1 Tax=Mesorhizobium sp. M6A.T.Ce.TU.002.03.1.1 TaxID=2496782 RepID=UPI000FC9A35E|nr:hypothetical protein [Mesorhizobium sp. M6A.T.Ce.TU.002.03.1.1]RUU46631.1 hypothetical protein EOC93_02335 [Mesorhizobium sp. M6A.T.Ce.TU.002.03.1.1]
MEADGGDASLIFGNDPENMVTLSIIDVHVPVVPLIVTPGAGVAATGVDFEAFSDSGQKFIGHLFTWQLPADVAAIVRQSWAVKRRLCITAVRTEDPHASGRLWLSGTIHLSGDEPRMQSTTSRHLH